MNSVPPSHRLTLLKTLHARRIVGAWGTATKVPLAPPKATDKDEWRFLGSWREVHEKQRTSLAARQILFAWHTGFTLPLDINLQLDIPFKPDQPWLEDRFGCKYLKSSIWDPL
ncbi:unnamed protein product [marine sediment metagenome]|uniref:Uncharacterized protein n=1 Tax=marine sediment metagenome TaxID=412755 RepID=X1QML3_9ZZZZ